MLPEQTQIIALWSQNRLNNFYGSRYTSKTAVSWAAGGDGWGVFYGDVIDTENTTNKTISVYYFSRAGQGEYVQASNDNSNWTTIGSYTAAGSYGKTTINTSYRYIRVYSANNHGYGGAITVSAPGVNL